jgi:hypothetical protein
MESKTNQTETRASLNQANFFQTPEQIIRAFRLHGSGDILKLDLDKQKEAYDMVYVPILIKGLDGEYRPLNLKYLKSIIQSSAKPFNKSQTGSSIPKFCNVAFHKLNDESLELSDYYSEDEKQSLIRSTNQLVKALSIINNEFELIVNRDLADIIHEDPERAKSIRSFVQTHRYETDTRNLVELPNPIYRIRLIPEACQITDVKTKKLRKDLTVMNCGKYITYQSTTSGIIRFDSVCVSDNSIILLNKFRELYVNSHPIRKQSAFDDTEVY